MKNKVIFLGYLPLTKKTAEDFCLSILYNAGYEVEYWDVTKIFFKHVAGWEVYSPPFEVKAICRYRELDNLIKSNRDALFIPLMSFEGRLFRLIWMFNKYNCKSMAFNLCSIPFHNAIMNINKYQRLRRTTLSKVCNKIKGYLMQCLIRYGYMRYYNYVLASGKYGEKYTELQIRTKLSLLSTKLLSFNTTDYNIYLNTRQQKALMDVPYIVFIDEYYPFHSDAALFDMGNISPDIYYKELIYAFDVIEKKYSMPVVIAAHPKALKYREHDFFEGRKVFFAETLRLIKDCKFAITHDSTAIDFAVFCMKPVLLLTSEEIKKNLPQSHDTIDYLSSFLNFPLLNMSRLTVSDMPNTMELSSIQIDLYLKFVDEYHTADSGGKTNEKLIVEYVKDIFSK